MALLEELLKKMVEQHGSDLHWKSDFIPHLRIDGDVHPVAGAAPLNAEGIKKEIYPLLSEYKRGRFERDSTVEFSLDRSDLGARFRGSLFLERGKVALNMRLIPAKVPNPEDMHLPPAVLNLTKERRGLILVTGPTGSGKSTTLAMMIDHINQTTPCHIISLEDPIEFVHNSKKALVSQRELGEDFHSFNDALRYALRQDPDVIMVGELRDLETVRLALQAAETGHLVLSTTHTVDAMQTVSRLIDIFPPNEQGYLRQHLAELLKGVVAMRLLRKKEGGRVPASEVMIGTSFVRKLIAENKLTEIPKAIEQGSHYGMQSFLQSILEVYNKGWATFEECQAAASNPDDFSTRARGIKTGS